MGLFGAKCCKCGTKVNKDFDSLDVFVYNYAKIIHDEFADTSETTLMEELSNNAIFENMDDLYCAECAFKALDVNAIRKKYFLEQEEKLKRFDQELYALEAKEKQESENPFDLLTREEKEASDFEEKLKKLKNLYEKGLISEAEYNNKKSEILNQI